MDKSMAVVRSTATEEFIDEGQEASVVEYLLRLVQR